MAEKTIAKKNAKQKNPTRVTCDQEAVGLISKPISSMSSSSSSPSSTASTLSVLPKPFVDPKTGVVGYGRTYGEHSYNGMPVGTRRYGKNVVLPFFHKWTHIASDIIDVGDDKGVKKYSKRFAEELDTDTRWFRKDCLRKQDVLELLTISAICAGLGSVVDKMSISDRESLEQELNAVSEKAYQLVLDNIPYSEIQETKSIRDSFLRHFLLTLWDTKRKAREA